MPNTTIDLGELREEEGGRPHYIVVQVAQSGRHSGLPPIRVELPYDTQYNIEILRGEPVAPPIITQFVAVPNSVTPNTPAILSWITSGADTLTISPTVGTVTGTQVEVRPTLTTTYTLTATNAGGSTSATAAVTVSITPPALPVINTFTSSAHIISPRESTTLSWSVSGAVALSLDNGIGAVAGVSRVVTPTASTTYTLTATNGAGSVTAQTRVIVRPASKLPYPVYVTVPDYNTLNALPVADLHKITGVHLQSSLARSLANAQADIVAIKAAGYPILIEVAVRTVADLPGGTPTRTKADGTTIPDWTDPTLVGLIPARYFALFATLQTQPNFDTKDAALLRWGPSGESNDVTGQDTTLSYSGTPWHYVPRADRDFYNACVYQTYGLLNTLYAAFNGVRILVALRGSINGHQYENYERDALYRQWKTIGQDKVNTTGIWLDYVNEYGFSEDYNSPSAFSDRVGSLGFVGAYQRALNDRKLIAISYVVTTTKTGRHYPLDSISADYVLVTPSSLALWRKSPELFVTPAVPVITPPATTARVTLNWNTNNGLAGILNVSIDGASEANLSNAASGSAPFQVETGHAYDFRLYTAGILAVTVRVDGV